MKYNFSRLTPEISMKNSSSTYKPINMSEPNNKWVVVTIESSSPYNYIINLSKALPQWQIVVVGNQHSPLTIKLANVHQLDVSRDFKSSMILVKLLKDKPWGRKNLGYLYAIQNNATLIYDTEEDYLPLNELKSFDYAREVTGLQYTSDDIVFDTYKHFGQPLLKPRGYPIETSNQKYQNLFQHSTRQASFIQHGVINKYPDVHPWYRTIYKSDALRNGINFERTAPPVSLRHGAFSPFNSKNTLFRFEAFWALILPVSPGDGLQDTIRSYWSQRLLREIGGTVGFYPPTCERLKPQKLSISSNFGFSYLIEFLTEWRCDEELSFFQCVLSLTRDMVKQNFWKETDLNLIEVWIHELKSLGYPEFPRIKFNSIEETSYPVYPVVYTPIEVSTGSRDTKWKQLLAIIDVCSNSSFQISRGSLTPTVYPNILLIVMFNNPFYTNIPYIELMYRVSFNQIVYCGSDIQAFYRDSRSFQDNVTFIEQTVSFGVTPGDTYTEGCISAALSMNYDMDGYLVIMDDVLLNSWNLKDLQSSFDKVWYDGFDVLYRNTSSEWHWWNKPVGRAHFNPAWEEIVNLTETRPDLKAMVTTYIDTLRDNTGSSLGAYNGMSDIVYIPRKYREPMILITDIYYKHKVFLEVAVPSALGGLCSLKDMVQMKGQYLWYDGKREKIPQLFKKEDLFLHPVKLSQIHSKLKNFFCEQFFPLLS